MTEGKKVKTDIKPKAKKEALRLVNFKTTAKEREILTALARKYTDGVVSEWIRMVATDPRFLKSGRVRVSPKKSA